MANLFQSRPARLIFGVVLVLFGLGGIVAGFIGQVSIPLRYIIGGIVMILIGSRFVLDARQPSR